MVQLKISTCHSKDQRSFMLQLKPSAAKLINIKKEEEEKRSSPKKKNEVGEGFGEDEDGSMGCNLFIYLKNFIEV